jgi:3-oxoacyl-[acyl-carrier protein] reductase
MNQIDLKGRAGIITGGARGIGLACAARLAASGARVAIWDIDGKEAEVAAKRIGEMATGRGVDVTDEAQVAQARDAAIKAFGKVDILICNAGIAGPNLKTWDYALAEWNKVVSLNLTAVFLCCKALAPHMSANKWGRIVNIASIAGKEGNPNASAYSATKAGVIGLTKSLGKELAEAGVLVNCITPAAIKTDIFKQMTQAHIDYMLSKIPMNRFGLVEEVGALAAWLSSPDCSFSTGAVFDLSGGRATY